MKTELTISKDLIDEMLDDNISRKRYKEIKNAIEFKVEMVWYELCHLCGRKVKWWAYDNDVSYRNGNGSSGGEFDPEIYYENIEMIGEYTNAKKYYDLYDYGFPTRFLWEENWQEEVITDCENYKKSEEQKQIKSKQKREELKQNKEKFRKIIESKLTKEELKYIKFK